MRYKIILAAFFLFPEIVFAGAANASLECAAKSKKSAIKLSGIIPVAFEDFQILLKNANGVIDVTDKNGTISVISDFGRGVFTVAVTLKDTRDLSLYAIPSTVKSSMRTYPKRARFDALLNAPEPSHTGDPHGTDSWIRDELLTCTYEYNP